MSFLHQSTRLYVCGQSSLVGLADDIGCIFHETLFRHQLTPLLRSTFAQGMDDPWIPARLHGRQGDYPSYLVSKSCTGSSLMCLPSNVRSIGRVNDIIGKGKDPALPETPHLIVSVPLTTAMRVLVFR